MKHTKGKWAVVLDEKFKNPYISRVIYYEN